MPAYYHNEMLFSEIYLEEITRQPENAEVLATFNVLKDFREFSDISSLQAWKAGYVREVLSTLGFFAQSIGEHTYNLYPNGSSGDEPPLSICYVLLPDENLDNTSMGRNWAEKIIRTLREKSLQWGLLTNGKQWRIYHTDEPTPYETYLEIDLDSILRDRAKEPYQIFFKFMQAQNFADKGDGKCQFDRFKKESQDKIDYIEKELAKALKQREGEKGKGVLQDLCLGYVAELRRRKDGDLDDEVLRKKIYHGAMLYMFRLLFLLYADARGLLSDENHAQLAKVLTASQPEKLIENGIQHSTILWEDLETIFVDIDQTYNGGLFSPQESEFTLFLSETPIANAYLANVVFNLTTYHEKNGEEKPISYRDMGVRHLGTLYEGLLEHKLFIAEEDTEVKVSKGKIQFIPASRGGKLVIGHYIKAGEVYFAGDPSERKSTGSYYTPEYIVDYIVRNTVGEKLKELKDAFLQEQRPTQEAYNRAVDEDERRALAVLLEVNALTFVREKVLVLSVLDPAMGSGHFLVNATNLISNFATGILNETGIQGNLDTGTGHWRRWVVENCIYGVDINPLAVELAKLSLWILSMAKNQPLSFLNHHLKCGNSLVGAKLAEIGNYPFSTAKKEIRQLTLFERDPDFKAAVEEVIIKSRLIAGKASSSLEDVREKKEWLEEIDSILEGYKTICDVHTSLFFGNTVEEPEYARMVQKKDFNLARSFTISSKYFNWELEFPDICISRGGFSCIVCNPPYDTFKETPYFSKQQAAGTGNLFGHFIVKSTEINMTFGNMGFVVPLSFACGSSFENCRRTIYKSYNNLKASHYSIRPAKLFPGVDQRITIFICLNKGFNHNGCDLYSSRLWRWHTGGEEKVVQCPDLGHIGRLSVGIIPKAAGEFGASIYNTILSQSNNICELLGDTEIPGYYHSVARYWVKAYSFIPFFKRDGEATPTRSTKLKELRFRSVLHRDLFILLVNSSAFYYWWIARGDEFDVTAQDILEFRFSLENIQKKYLDISILSKELMEDYQKNAVNKYSFAGGKKIQYQEFYPRLSKEIIYKIDDFLSPFFGLSNEQNRFLKEYDLIWRTDEEKEE